MSKWISCTVTAFKVVLVECEDDDADPGCTAAGIAGNEAFDGTFDEITSVEVPDDELERAKRHADLVLNIGESA